MQRCSFSLEIREMQIKISRYHFIPTRLAKPMYWRRVEKTELDRMLGEVWKVYEHVGEMDIMLSGEAV